MSKQLCRQQRHSGKVSEHAEDSDADSLLHDDVETDNNGSVLTLGQLWLRLTRDLVIANGFNTDALARA